MARLFATFPSLWFQNWLKFTSLCTVIRETTPFQKQDLSQCSNDYFSNPNNRIDCFPRGIATKETCVARGCCWNRLKDFSKEPWCYYPQNYKSYQLEAITNAGSEGMSLLYKNVFKSPYPGDTENLKVDVFFETNKRLRIKIYDANNSRYESPYPKVSKDYKAFRSTDYSVEFENLQKSNFGFAVLRKSSNRVLFDTRGIGGFTFSDQFLQITAKLSSNHLYGLGEVSKPFSNDFDWKTFGVFAHDHIPTPYSNVYGSHPFYLSMEEDAKAHGVFLLNSNALEFSLQPIPALTYRAIGGILDFYFFLGDNPSEVIEQYLQLIGKPNFPPYWSLGFQLSKYGWNNIKQVEDVLDRTVKAGIPLDVIYGDIDYMDKRLGFTYDKVNYSTLPQFISQVHSLGMRYVPILDPGIDTDHPSYAPFEEGMKMDIFIKHEDGTLFKGKVWSPGHTAFPDFTNPNTYGFWSNQLKNLYSNLKYDGLWIDMNEPANPFQNPVVCPNTKWDNPPFTPKIDSSNQQGLRDSTICPSAKQFLGRHYDVHNLYGISQTELTFRSLKELLRKRPFVLTRSTFPGSGHYGNHWTGDNAADWESLKQSITDMMLMNMFGLPMIGADICGFVGNVDSELCARWSQLGAFYPFSRNHNSIENKEHDPAAVNMGPIVRESAKKALLLRYSLLPYLYTLFHKAHILGHTVVRPLFFEFPKDKNTYALDEQFLWGSALLIAPVLKQGAVKVEIYLPKGIWYTYPDFEKKFMPPGDGSKIVLDAPITEIPILIRGGCTIVTQTPDTTTAKSRLNDFQIVVVLDKEGQSKGEIFWDDGETLDTEDYNFIELSSSKQCVNSTVIRYYHEIPMTIDKVKVVGVNTQVQKVTIDVLQAKENLKFSLDENIGVLTIDTKPNPGVTFETNFRICWF